MVLGINVVLVPLLGGRWVDELDQFRDQSLVFAEQLEASHHLDLSSFCKLCALSVAEFPEAVA